jgi:hypothetical protein
MSIKLISVNLIGPILIPVFDFKHPYHYRADIFMDILRVMCLPSLSGRYVEYSASPSWCVAAGSGFRYRATAHTVPHACLAPFSLLLVTNRRSYLNLRFPRRWLWRMASSGILRRVARVRTDVSEELSTSFIMATRIGKLGTTLAVTSNRRTLIFLPDEGGAKFLRNVGSY